MERIWVSAPPRLAADGFGFSQRPGAFRARSRSRGRILAKREIRPASCQKGTLFCRTRAATFARKECAGGWSEGTPVASCKNYLKVLQSLSVACLGIVTGSCLSSSSAFADACSDLTSQYNVTLHAYQASKFQFPEDCPRAHDYFRARREQAQSLVSLLNAAKQTCGSQLKDRGPPPEELAALLEHEAVTLETGCNVIAGVQTVPTPQPPPPAVAAAPAATPPPPGQPQPTVPPSNQAAAPAPPPPPAQAASPPPSQTASAPANPSAAQSCAAQKSMSPAPGCNADFPQLVTGAACAAADNSVGLTLQIAGREPTCCVTSCGRSK